MGMAGTNGTEGCGNVCGSCCCGCGIVDRCVGGCGGRCGVLARSVVGCRTSLFSLRGRGGVATGGLRDNERTSDGGREPSESSSMDSLFRLPVQATSLMAPAGIGLRALMAGDRPRGPVRDK